MPRDNTERTLLTGMRLEIVLDLLLDLAIHGDRYWSEIKMEMIRRGQHPSAFDTLRNALRVSWKKPEREDRNSSNRDRGANKTRASWLKVTSTRYEANDQQMKTGTFDAIQQCLDVLNRGVLDAKNGAAKKLNTRQIDYTFGRLRQLGVLVEESDNDNKSKGYRKFAIDFSGCPALEKGRCQQYIKQLANQKFAKEKAVATLERLDALVLDHRAAVESTFLMRRSEEKKQIHVPLKANIMRPGPGERQSGECVPRPEDFSGVVEASGSQMILIWEEGGAGKTSLAFEIATWGLQLREECRLASHTLLPYFLDPSRFDLAEQAPLSRHVARFLENLGGLSVSQTEVEDLLRHKRLLLIVDHFSELTTHQRDWVEANLPPNALVLLTSRLRDYGERFRRAGWTVTEVQPQRLKDEELFQFFELYLRERGRDSSHTGKEGSADSLNPLLSPDDQAHTRELLGRMVGNQPITVLLAWMVIEKAIQHIRQRKADPKGVPAEVLPSSVPELMREYVANSNRSIAPENRWLRDHPDQEPGFVTALLKALALAAHRQDGAFHPQNFDSALASKAWTAMVLDGKVLDGKVLDHQQQKSLLTYMEKNLTLLTLKVNDPIHPEYRLALDPLADYLAAMAQQESWERGRDRETHRREIQAWLDQLRGRRERGETDDERELDALSRMRGFLAACRDCYKEWLSRCRDCLDEEERRKWERILDDFARAAKIDRVEERILEAKHLIRRHATDLEWANPELRPKAIAELTAYAREFREIAETAAVVNQVGGIRELEVAVAPLLLTMAKTTYPEADRAAAAEALGHIGGPTAAAALIKMMTNKDEPAVAVRRAAAEALGLIDASPDDPNPPWTVLDKLLADEANHLHGETDFARIDAKLPLLRGASRGLQRLAARSSQLPHWGTGPGLTVPMLTLTVAAKAVTTRRVNVEVWQLPLPDRRVLEVVEIPGGTYTIGSPPEEEGRDAYGHLQEATGADVEAQRQVTVPPFAMARFPITQAQWRTLTASSHALRRPLREDPAKHKGADLPVENVSWLDASEWCARLNQYLTAVYREGAPRVGLPSESLWEVACRAESLTPSSPFHFGDMLDSSWANYDASHYVYRKGRFPPLCFPPRIVFDALKPLSPWPFRGFALFPQGVLLSGRPPGAPPRIRVKDSASIPPAPCPHPPRWGSQTHHGRNKKHKAGCLSERRPCRGLLSNKKEFYAEPPIPGLSVPLSAARKGQRLRVLSLPSHPALRQRLCSMGIQPGAEVEVLRRGFPGGILHVACGLLEFMLRQDQAEELKVALIHPQAS